MTAVFMGHGQRPCSRAVVTAREQEMMG